MTRNVCVKAIRLPSFPKRVSVFALKVCPLPLAGYSLRARVAAGKLTAGTGFEVGLEDSCLLFRE